MNEGDVDISEGDVDISENDEGIKNEGEDKMCGWCNVHQWIS